MTAGLCSSTHQCQDTIINQCQDIFIPSPNDRGHWETVNLFILPLAPPSTHVAQTHADPPL